jgi:hypothetical protein
MYTYFYFVIFPIIIKSNKNNMSCNTLHLAKGYDPLYSSSPLVSLDGFSRSHGDDLYVMQLSRRAYNIENMVDIKNLKKFHHATVCMMHDL